MFFSFSFPLEEKLDFAELTMQLKRINRFLKKADLNSNTRVMGIQLLTPDNMDLLLPPSDYYLRFVFFNPQKETQKKLNLLYSIGDDDKIYRKLRHDVCCFSFIASLPLHSVVFSEDGKNLNVLFELDDSHFERINLYVKMLFANFQ